MEQYDILYSDDDQHPISKVEDCDLIGEREDGGYDLILIIERPVRGDERSQNRLIRKFQNYLEFIRDRFPDALEPKCRGKYKLIIDINNGSSGEIFDLTKSLEAIIAGTAIVIDVYRR